VKKFAPFALWIAVLLIGAYEFWALAVEGSTSATGLTISEIIWNVTLRHPLVPFVAGMLAGHFFWQQAPPTTPKE
jgi:hypothetical protein